nr:MAG TPA: Rtr1/RPAP2 family [Caudoviricetes sp.]
MSRAKIYAPLHMSRGKCPWPLCPGASCPCS